MNKDTNTELGNLNAKQLYNLKTDPGETTNLADKYPEKVAKLQAMLTAVKAK